MLIVNSAQIQDETDAENEAESELEDLIEDQETLDGQNVDGQDAEGQEGAAAAVGDRTIFSGNWRQRLCVKRCVRKSSFLSRNLS